MYHFLSGYTAKVAGTEIGVTEPTATFSTCFGAAFMPRPPSVYGNLLKKRIAEADVTCWLVNTGWTGGKYGVGKRMPIKATRTLLNAALDGSLNQGEFRKDPNFGFEVPTALDGCTDLLDPRTTWADRETNMTALRRSLSTCSSRTSRNSWTRLTTASGPPRQRPGDNKRSHKPSPTTPQLNGPLIDRAQTRDPTDARLPAQTVHHRRRDRTSRRRACSTVHSAARNGPTRPIWQPPPICCCADPTSASMMLAGLIPPFQRERRWSEQRQRGLSRDDYPVFLHGIRLFLAEADVGEPLHELVNQLLLSRWDGATGRCDSIRAIGCFRSMPGGASSSRTSRALP